MKAHRVLVAIASLSALTTALAGEDEAYMTGVGATTCAKYAALYASNPEYVEGAVFSWAQGYMSARNLELMQGKKTFRDLMAMSIEEQQASIRSFCDLHPLREVAFAVQALFSTLPIKPVNTGK